MADISIYSSPCPIITPKTIKATTARYNYSDVCNFLNIHCSDYFLCETKMSINVIDESSISFTILSIFETM